MQTIALAKQNRVRVSVVGLAAQVHVCSTITQVGRLLLLSHVKGGWKCQLTRLDILTASALLHEIAPCRGLAAMHADCKQGSRA